MVDGFGVLFDEISYEMVWVYVMMDFEMVLGIVCKGMIVG